MRTLFSTTAPALTDSSTRSANQMSRQRVVSPMSQGSTEPTRRRTRPGSTSAATSFQAGCRYAETKVVPGGRKSVTTTSGAA